MLRRFSTYITVIRLVLDIATVAFVWNAAYFLRFYSGIFSDPKGIPDFKRHLMLTFPITLISGLIFHFVGLYKPKRVRNLFLQIMDVFKAGLFSSFFVLAFLYYIQDVPYSRKLLAMFFIMLFIGLVSSHLLAKAIMGHLRRKGYNLRYYAVIGTGWKGRQLVCDIEKMGWLGLKCIFFVDDDPNCIGTQLMGIPVYGPIQQLAMLIKTEVIDEVYLTLSGSKAQKAYPILEALQSKGMTIRIIPDWGNLISISRVTATSIGSQVLFSATESPLSGANMVLKEVFDRVAALMLLVVLAIPMAVIAILIKLTGNGTIFYKQTRVGLDQQEFEVLKFRTMIQDAQTESELKWTSSNDPRCTVFGRWLRRTSLDELPQLINVLQGKMSLVGPRPERPFFVKQFSEEYKRYMLRHNVKTGMTGWAQINDFRGNTALRKRLLYDLYYVGNWSLWLDMWILLKTPWSIIKGKNAY